MDDDDATRAFGGGGLEGGVLDDAEVPTRDQALDLDDEAELAAAYALTEGDEDEDILSDDLSDLDARRIAELSDSTSPSDDPVRMYLREISITPLLTVDQELRLCATYSTEQLLARLEGAPPDGSDPVWRGAYQHLRDAWREASAQCAARQVPPPELAAILREARDMPAQYMDPTPCYMERYLRDLGWGQDLTVEKISKPLFEVALAAIVLPPAFVDQAARHEEHAGGLAEVDWEEASAWLPPPDECEDHAAEVRRRAEEARQALDQRQPAPGGQHRQALPGPRHRFLRT